jgi:hypothetical protein
VSVETDCPEPGLLKALLDGTLSPPDETMVGRHLETCPRCQQALEALVADGASWAELPRRLRPEQPEAGATLHPALARSTRHTRAAETQPEASASDLPPDFLDASDEVGHLGRLGRYEVRRVIGRGGMGIVLEAIDPSLQRVAAIKVMAPQLASLGSARKRFLREAQAAAAVCHENIVAIHAVDEHKGLPYLVLQYVPGLSLEERIADGPLEVRDIVRIGMETAKGLAAAHGRGLVHRDVKPANILLEEGSGRVRLTDFGLARAVDDATLTQSGVVTGTPQYMSPEQARGEPVDHRTDLFSLGSVLYAMATGQPPFAAATPLVVLRKVTDEEPPAIRDVNPAIPRWLVAIIARLHAKKPADRFASAEEVATLLGRHLDQLLRCAPILAPVTEIVTLAPPAPAPHRRRRWPAVAAVAACLLVALGVGAYQLGVIPFGNRKAPPQSDPNPSAEAPPEKPGPEANPAVVPPEDKGKLAQQARETLATYCYRCHGQEGAVEGGFNYLMDRDLLVQRKKVVPGDPEKSRLLRRVVKGEMPPPDEKQRPGPDDVALLQRWVAAGAPAFGPAPAPRSFIAPGEVAQAIQADLSSRPERDRRFTRYFTLTHLYNAGLSEDELQTYRNGLAKLVNSLSWRKAIVVPAPVDAARTILRIDIRDYGWTDKDWEALLAQYPYGTNDRSPPREYAATASGPEVPEVRGDWFVATASRPPLYHQLLQLPKTDRELGKMLHIDVEANIQGERVARAGFNDSGVSRNNRLIERHETPYGAYWKSYDFAENDGPQNLFARPLGPGNDERTFRHAGGEIIFNLPNGLQGYLLVNGQGQRLDKAPTEIVSDPKRPDRAVENGLSCMACHSRGINPKADQVRAHVETNKKSFPKEEFDTILALYPPAEAFKELQRKDAERFEQAAAATGARVGVTEPIMALAAQFEAPLDLRRAAAEVGLRPEDFVAHLDESPEIGRAIGALRLPGQTVQRQTFVRLFPEMVEAWAIGTGRHSQVKPPAVVEETPPISPSVIPSPKLTGRVEVPLGEAAEQVRTGGAGRYLIFHLKKKKKLTVFDVAQAKVAHEIDAPDDVQFAAGLDKLMVVVPGQRLLQRWDLRSGKREKTAPMPQGGPVLNALMGCNGRGPLFLFYDGILRPWDVDRLEPAALDHSGLGGDPTYWFQTRISADGQVLTVWHGGLSGQQYGLVRMKQPRNTLARSPDGHTFNGHWAMPNADGSLVFRFGSGIYDGDMHVVGADAFKGQVLLPTEDPRFFLAIQEESRDTNRVSICNSTDRRVLFTLGGVEKMTGSSLNSGWGLFRGEPRVHYLPSANVLVNLPESNDRVVVRPLNLIEALNQSGQDYVVVLSRPESQVAAGATFTYRMDVHSKAGGLRYTLESAPEGMTVSSAGVIRWKAPERPDRKPARVVVTIRSSSGKEYQHAFDVTVVEPSEVPAPPQAPKPVGRKEITNSIGMEFRKS